MAQSHLNNSKILLSPESGASVAIVMRTKDRPMFLVRALGSVINQTFADWHLFLINDGGDPVAFENTLGPYRTKLSGKLTLIYNPVSLGAESASNVTVRTILDTNAGKPLPDVPAARHFAYCAIHNDDDFWEPHFLQETVGYLEAPENSGKVGVYTRFTIVRGSGTDNRFSFGRGYPSITLAKRLSLRRLFGCEKFPAISFLFRIESFNVNFSVRAGWVFLSRASGNANIGFLEKSYSYYYKLERSDSFLKHLLRLFNIPRQAPAKRKTFFKRLDSFLYQVFFKHTLKPFGKKEEQNEQSGRFH